MWGDNNTLLTIDTIHATSKLLQDVYAAVPRSTAKQNKGVLEIVHCFASPHLLVGWLLLQMHYYSIRATICLLSSAVQISS